MSFGLNFLAGASAGMQGYQAEERRTSDDARRQKADLRADQDATFREQERTRQRTAWSETDRIKAADKADLAAVNAQFNDAAQVDTGAADQAVAQAAVADDKMHKDIASVLDAPVDMLPGTAPAPKSLAADPNVRMYTAPPAVAASPKLAPDVVAKIAAGGVTRKPVNFNTVLDRQAELLRRKIERGDMTATDYTQQVGAINHWKEEGINDAMNLMSQGRYDEAMDKYNGVGSMRGARVVDGKEGLTKINGEDVPTHFVTIANADGSTAHIDVAKARYQMMDLNTQMAHVDRARQTTMQRDHYAGTREDNKAMRAQQASDAAAGRSLQAQQLKLQQMQFNANTPFGLIQAKEKALGTSLSADQKANLLGVDALPTQTRLQLTSYMKEQDQISQSMNKAQADGTWQPESQGARDMTLRSAMLNQRVSDLLSPTRRGAVDPAGILGNATSPTPTVMPARPGGAVPNPFTNGQGATPATATAPTTSIFDAVGGVQRAPAAQVSPVAKILGLSSDQAGNAIVLGRAAGIEEAAKTFLARQQEFVAAAKSGDQSATQGYLQRMQDARQVVTDAIGPIPEPQQEAVFHAVGM